MKRIRISIGISPLLDSFSLSNEGLIPIESFFRFFKERQCDVLKEINNVNRTLLKKKKYRLLITYGYINK